LTTKLKFLTVFLAYQQFGYFCLVSFIQKALKFYVNSSLHVAVSVLSLCHITLHFYETKPTMMLQIALFCATVVGYNFVKYFGLAKFHYRSLTTKLKEIQRISLLCVIGFLVVFFGLKLKVKIMLVVLGIVTFFYANPFETQTPIRKIKGVKVYIIATVWTFVTALIPILDTDVPLQREVYLAMFERFILILILMLPFEIRDLLFDDLKLSTIPQRIGVKNTKSLGYFGIILLALLMFYNDAFSPKASSILLLILLILALHKSDPKNNLNFTALWVEAIPILWWLSILIFEST